MKDTHCTWHTILYVLAFLLLVKLALWLIPTLLFIVGIVFFPTLAISLVLVECILATCFGISLFSGNNFSFFLIPTSLILSVLGIYGLLKLFKKFRCCTWIQDFFKKRNHTGQINETADAIYTYGTVDIRYINYKKPLFGQGHITLSYANCKKRVHVKGSFDGAYTQCEEGLMVEGNIVLSYCKIESELTLIDTQGTCSSCTFNSNIVIKKTETSSLVKRTLSFHDCLIKGDIILLDDTIEIIYSGTTSLKGSLKP